MMKVRKELQDLKSYKPGKPIEEIKRTLKIPQVYKLASNENPFPPLYIRKVLEREIYNTNRYPEADCFYLRQALSKKLKVSKEQLVFGNGSDEIIVMALRAFVREKEEIVVAYPTFLIYELQGRVCGAKIKKVPLKNYRYDLDTIAKSVTSRTRIVFIANPDNPHGTYVTHREVKRFLRKIPLETLVFFDEAYYEFAKGNGFPRTLTFLKERGNIVVTRTFSKAYGLAGLRIGYGITTPEIADVLDKVRDPFNVNRFAQAAAVQALKEKKFLSRVITHTRREKQFLYRELNNLGLSYIRSVTNFILVKFDGDTSALYSYLLRHGVIIRSMDGWGLKGFFRVTVGLHKENVAFIKYLRNYLNGKGSK